VIGFWDGFYRPIVFGFGSPGIGVGDFVFGGDRVVANIVRMGCFA
jgi:hypothetical protein